jgi:hypothetical protein
MTFFLRAFLMILSFICFILSDKFEFFFLCTYRPVTSAEANDFQLPFDDDVDFADSLQNLEEHIELVGEFDEPVLLDVALEVFELMRPVLTRLMAASISSMSATKPLRSCS